jgi:hypothetical protein
VRISNTALHDREHVGYRGPDLSLTEQRHAPPEREPSTTQTTTPGVNINGERHFYRSRVGVAICTKARSTHAQAPSRGGRARSSSRALRTAWSKL